MAKLVVLVAGNISSGKTTLVDYLVNNKQLFDPFLAEGESLLVNKEFIDSEALKLFYSGQMKKDPNYMDSFERICLEGRIVRHILAKDHQGIVIFDRGIIEGAETFAANSCAQGFLTYSAYRDYTDRMRDAFDKMSRLAEEQPKWLESLVVYLEVNTHDAANILAQRQKNRGTSGEDISPEYLAQINARYAELMGNIDKVYRHYGLNPPKLIKIDASVDMKKNSSYIESNAQRIVAEIGLMLK
jgi:deoxyadenosine/deoxycytidine kinase